MAPVTRSLAALAMLWAVGATAQEPVWYPPTEPSPFLPDDAHWVGQPPEAARGWARTIYLRGTWRVRSPVRRAVLMIAPSQTVDLYLDGRIALSGYDGLEALPAWAEVTDRLQPGELFAGTRVYSEWRPMLYSQLRVEYTDGSWEDLTTGQGWECATMPAVDWPINPRSAGDWHPAAVGGGYYRAPGEGIWGREFALLPREMLRERLEKHNSRLRASWPGDQREPPLKVGERPEDPQWANQFGGFCRVDEKTGQLIDGAGKVRHLFFTICSQIADGGAVLSVPDMDFDQLERGLDLMAKTGVHLYLRQTGWSWLLTADGQWAPLARQPKGTNLPHFERGIDLLSHFVRRAHAHGRYIVFEGDFYWGAHDDAVSPPYRSRYHLYPEVLEAQALATRKMMHHFSECPNVLGMMIGEEDIILAHDLANPHQHAAFADYLRAKYGSLDVFRQQTPRGYDYGDLSAYYRQSRAPEYWPGDPPQEVLVPRYVVREGVFDGAKEWLDIPLPLWPGFRSPGEPQVTLAGFKSYNEFTPEDPVWIDFYEMREDELLFGMLCRWVEIVRQGMPHQLLFYSNAQDFTNSWHFLHLYRRTDLPFDVIGVGCHDSGQDLSEIPAWATQRKTIKVVASYRPYVLAPGSPSRGVAPGEGEGGRPEHPEEILNYYRGALFDEIGGGCAWTQTYTWGHISGAAAGSPPHETPLLRWMADFMPAVQGAAFPLRRPVQVLIVRNANLQHSNMSGLDYGNVMTVAEALTQLNVEFDIVMDRDLATAAVRGQQSGVRRTAKANGVRPSISLDPYRLVIVPSVAIDLCDGAWEAVEEWLSDARHRGERVLAIGRVGKRGRRLQPEAEFCPRLQAWLGMRDYAHTVDLTGKQEVVLRDGGREQRLTFDFGHVPATGTFDAENTFLRAADGSPIAKRLAYRGNEIIAFGFPLGLAYENLWGLSPEQNPRDAMAPIYEALASAARLDRPILAPHNLRVYLSGDGKMLLVRERAGLKTETEIGVRLPVGVRFPGLAAKRTPEGYTRLQVSLEPWEGKWWKAG